MKKLVVCMLVMFCSIGISSAFAGEHLANVVWTTSNLIIDEVYSEDDRYVYASSFDLDVGLTASYYTVNGVVITSQGRRQACTGTGYIDQVGQISLDMQCGNSQIVLVLDGNLNGQAHVFNDDVDDSKPIYLYSMM